MRERIRFEIQKMTTRAQLALAAVMTHGNSKLEEARRYSPLSSDQLGDLKVRGLAMHYLQGKWSATATWIDGDDGLSIYTGSGSTPEAAWFQLMQDRIAHLDLRVKSREWMEHHVDEANALTSAQIAEEDARRATAMQVPEEPPATLGRAVHVGLTPEEP